MGFSSEPQYMFVVELGLVAGLAQQLVYWWVNRKASFSAG
jgi:hypothetical protein